MTSGAIGGCADIDRLRAATRGGDLEHPAILIEDQIRIVSGPIGRFEVGASGVYDHRAPENVLNADGLERAVEREFGGGRGRRKLLEFYV